MSAPRHGIVKQVNSADCVVIRDRPKGGPPPEYTVFLSSISAPKIARRANPNVKESVETKDEPYGWEAREFLRKKLIGKDVYLTIENTTPLGRLYGSIFIGKDTTGENISESLVSEGLAEVKKTGGSNEYQQRLLVLEDAAKAAQKGKWAQDAAQRVREVKWAIDNPRHFVDSHHQKAIPAIIEHVRDGCTVRAFLLPSFHYVTVMMAGIKCPMFKNEGEKQIPEPFALEAKYFTECRLLQRDVEIILEGVSNQQNLLGTIIHPNGDIAEALLKEGFARCVDWSMGVVTQGTEKLRIAEKLSKEKRLRIWKDYQPPTTTVDIKDKNFTAKVVEVVNSDALVVKLADGTFRKIFLASIRPPRAVDSEDNKKTESRGGARSRPLYDVPYMFEAREFLRKKLVGNKVSVQVDYVQAAQESFPEKTCCTVTVAGINVGEALVSKGFATVIRYRQDDDQRSSSYDALLAAETRAQKKGVGIHSKKETPFHKIADVSGDVNKAKQFLPFLQRAKRVEALVEFVASGSRMRVFIARETCLVTLLLSGIECPRGSRQAPSGGGIIPAEPFGEEALQFTKELILQREVEAEVESMDKGGNFIGWVFYEGTNLSVALVEAGLAKVHFTAERSSHYKALCAAQEAAKSSKANLWSKEEEVKVEPEPENEERERKVDYQKVIITEVNDRDLHFYAQFVDNGGQLEKMMEQLRSDFAVNPPVPGAYTPKKGDLCAAKFSFDNEWYRVKIEKVEQDGVYVFYIDYGNREKTNATRLANLPGAFRSLPPQATEYTLACVKLPQEVEAIKEVCDTLYQDIMNREMSLNVEYRATGGNCECVSLLYSDSREDVAQSLLSEGLVLLETRKEKWLQQLLAGYKKAQEKAKLDRRNLWRYGDFTDDDAKEFGFPAK